MRRTKQNKWVALAESILGGLGLGMLVYIVMLLVCMVFGI